MSILVASIEELPEPFVPSNRVYCSFCLIACWESKFSAESNQIICRRLEGQVTYMCGGCSALAQYIVDMRSPV